MANTTNLRVTELDFDQIKSNLKTFLASQSEFTDYDFEGSSLSVLLDILSYNTHYNAIYANLIANEMFLDTASKRSSVVSLAKHFGYTPQSITSARARLNLTVTTTGSPQSLMLPKYTPFTTSIDNVNYTFYNLSNIVTTPVSGNTFTFSDFEIVEGMPLTYSYLVQNGQNKFLLPNYNIDTTTLTVNVQTSGTDPTLTPFNLAGNTQFTTVSSTDAVYFLEETRDGSFQLVFGDGNIGKALVDGNIIQITYLVSSGTSANNATVFTLGGISAFTVSTFSLSLSQKAMGGTDPESTESVRTNASKFFVTQNRAVTAEDYKNIIVAEYPNVDAISAWGGDTVTPPVYGKVFISAKPTNGTTLSKDIQEKLQAIINRKNVVGITAEFIDPEYVYLKFNTSFNFDPSKTVSTQTTMEANVLASIKEYVSSDLNNFDSIFRKSKMSRMIDYTDKSLLNNSTTVTIYKYLQINSENPLNYKIDFKNPVGAISSTAFRLYNDSIDYFIKDDGNGNIVLYHINNTKQIIDNQLFGSVDYSIGVITIPTVQFSLLTSNCKVFAEPMTDDVVASHNQIITVLDSDITVTGHVDTRKPMVR